MRERESTKSLLVLSRKREEEVGKQREEDMKRVKIANREKPYLSPHKRGDVEGFISREFLQKDHSVV